MRCPACDRENAEHYKFCLSCGGPLEPPEPQSRYSLPKADQLADLLAEADDYERFGMLDDAIRCLRRAVVLSGDRATLRARLEALQARAAERG